MSEPDFSEDKPGAQSKAAKIATNPDSMTPANDAGVSAFSGCYLPADFQKWAVLPFWWPAEAACVTLGFDPGPVFHAAEGERECSQSYLLAIQNRLELFSRAVAMGVIEERIQPIEAIGLLDSRDAFVPPELRSVISKIKPYGPLIGIPAGVNKLEDVIRSVSQPQTDDLPPKLQRSIDMMLAAMAIYGYCFDPASKKSNIGKEIADDIARLGLSLTPPVCAKLIRDSCKRLSIERTPDD